MPTRKLHHLVLAALLGAPLCLPAPPARADRPPTNSELVGRALEAAADSLLANLPAVAQGHLVLLPANGQAPQWGVENELAARLKQRVKWVSFHGALSDTAAPLDSAQLAAGARPAASIVDKRPLDPEAAVLEYRVATLGVTYTDVHKARIFGASEVERSAQASLAARLLSPQGGLVWTGHGSGAVLDRVPQDMLPSLEDNLYQFHPPTLPSGDITKFLEPAIVVALVSGLVFLFYTNRN